MTSRAIMAPRPPLRELWLGIVMLFGAVVLSAALVKRPFEMGSLALASLAMMAVGTVTFFWPKHALRLAFGILVVGSMRLRERDALASVAGVIDAQIMFELGCYGAVCLIAVIALFRSRYWRRVSIPEGLLIGFVLLAFISTAWTPVAKIAVVRTAQVAIVLLVSYAATGILGPTRALRVLFVSLTAIALTASAITVLVPSTSLWVSASAGAVKFLNNPDGVASGRFAWFAMHPSTIGTFTAAAALYWMAELMDFGDGKRGSRRVSWIALLLLLCVVFAAKSRGPMAALFAGTCVLVFWRIIRSRTLVILVPLVAAFLLVAVVAMPSPLELLQEGEAVQNPIAAFLLRDEGFSTFMTLNGRTELWAAIIPLIVSRPVLGYGYLAGRLVLMDKVLWSPGHAHNALIQTLLDLGAVGMLFLWVPIATILIPRLPGAVTQAAHVRRAQAVIGAVAACVVAHSMADASFASYPGFELVSLFACISAISLLRRGDVR